MTSTDSDSDVSTKSLSDLTSSVAVVTGGGTGIGLMIAKVLAANGAKVYITGRRADVLESASSSSFEGSGKLVPLQMDVTDKSSILAVVNQIAEEDKKLDILVNNAAALGPVVPFVVKPDAPERRTASSYGNALFNSQEFADWDVLTSANVASVFFVTNAFLGLLEASTVGKPDGWTASVINITSCVSHTRLSRGMYAYTPIKAATSHLNQLLATDYALNGFPIRVNAIAPGLFATQLTGTEAEMDEYSKTNMGALLPIPMKRQGREHEMAALALYFASPASVYTTGQEIVIDGGFTRVNP